MAIIRGTDKKNKLKGKATDDRLYGLFGNDLLDGGAGDDILSGHDGTDRLIGGLGDDELNGGAGRDNLMGGDGDDEISGGYGIWNDVLRGGDARDYLYGGEGNDRLFGDDGDDTLYGAEGNDRLVGGDGNDTLSDGDGKDNLNGGDGNDVISGGTDEFSDKLAGGAGNDHVRADKGDVATGGTGFDTFSTSAYTSYDAVPPLLNVNLSKITGKKAADIGLHGTRAGQFEKAEVTLYGIAEGSMLTGSKGDDTLAVYTSTGVTINGGKGDDKLTASGGNTLIGGAGSDVFGITYYSTPVTIVDFTAKDFLLTTSYFDLDDEQAVGMDLFNPLVSGADPVANSAKAQFLYDTDDGRLLFDVNGTTIGGERHIFTLANRPALKASNFIFDF